ncbi:hypothetical protein [Vibrio phage VH7D]|uniref:Uncharacterized protein n=1 Tax=Vibrio phage VH7D TaxID=1262539 RepID=V9LZT9_9CAUD|nr:hypothetical protein CF80_gp051 [Vibrio phage VH7D]AGB06838.1 hypothetical protein [Vibrio phage VH7D]
MNAYRINTSIEDLAIVKGDLFVQSPFNEHEYKMARQPQRPPMHIDLITQFHHLYNETTAADDEIAELVLEWKNQYKTRTEALNMFRQSLLEQRQSIDEQIKQTTSTIEQLREKFGE